MRRRRINLVPQEPITKDSCRHYWIIESARGPTSRGVCKFCGAEKEFHNAWPYFPVGKPSEKLLEVTEVGEPIKEEAEEAPEEGEEGELTEAGSLKEE